MDESPGKMYALATVMTVLAIVPTVLRFRLRHGSTQGIGLDDWMTFVALVGTIGTAAAMYVATAHGGLGLHTAMKPNGRPIYTEATVTYLKANFVTFLTQIVTFGSTKLAVLLFYRRIFTGRIFDIASWTLIVLTIVWSVSYFFANLFECNPIESNWAGNGVGGHCVDELKLYISESWTDVLLDIMILSIPIPIVAGLHLKSTQKVAICGIFLLGALVVLAGVARLIVYYHIKDTIYKSGAKDITWLVAPTFYWPLIESAMGILEASLPALRPMFRGFSPESVIGSVRSLFSLRSSKSSRLNSATDKEKALGSTPPRQASDPELGQAKGPQDSINELMRDAHKTSSH